MNPDLRCDAVLFDLDGVLIDSSTSIARHWANWAAQHDIDVALILRVAHGVRSVETIQQVAPQLDALAEAARLTAWEVADTAGVVAMPGARRLLEALPSTAWTIVTSGSAELAHARLRAAELPVPARLITADDVTSGKPAPEPYLRGAALLGVSPAACVVIEDAPAGIEAGRRAGMRVVGVASTHTRADLLACGVTALIERLADLRITAGSGQPRLRIAWSAEP